MKKLYFIQYNGEDIILENKIISLGRYYKVFSGWVVETTTEAKELHEFLSSHNSSMDIIVFGLDKKNYWGRYKKELWDFFK